LGVADDMILADLGKVFCLLGFDFLLPPLVPGVESSCEGFTGSPPASEAKA
jgi:hypothetical protein